MDVRASRAAFVGDMLELDVMGPKNLGTKTVLVEHRPVKGIDKVRPDKIIKDLNELLGVLVNC